MSSHIVLVSATGEVSVVDEELRIQRTYTPQNHQPNTLVKHFLFPAASCSFLPSHTISPYSVVSVSFLRSGDVLRLDVVGIAEENVNLLGECVVPTDETVSVLHLFCAWTHCNVHLQDILDISCSDDGFISILSRFSLNPSKVCGSRDVFSCVGMLDITQTDHLTLLLPDREPGR